jgi:hypothetical protein
MGKPSSGRLSVVVTDIQGYSQLMDECPEDMQQVGCLLFPLLSVMAVDCSALNCINCVVMAGCRGD